MRLGKVSLALALLGGLAFWLRNKVSSIRTEVVLEQGRGALADTRVEIQQASKQIGQIVASTAKNTADRLTNVARSATGSRVDATTTSTQPTHITRQNEVISEATMIPDNPAGSVEQGAELWAGVQDEPVNEPVSVPNPPPPPEPPASVEHETEAIVSQNTTADASGSLTGMEDAAASRSWKYMQEQEEGSESRSTSNPTYGEVSAAPVDEISDDTGVLKPPKDKSEGSRASRHREESMNNTHSEDENPASSST